HVRDRRGPLGYLDGQMRHPFQHTERAPHWGGPHAFGRWTLVRVARRHEQAIDVAAESVLVLRVGDRRAEDLRNVLGDPFARERERRERAIDVLAANEIEDEPGLLRRCPHVARRGVRLDHAAPPGFAAPAAAPPPPPAGAPGAPGPPGPAAAAAAAAAARSATRVVCPLKIRVGA